MPMGRPVEPIDAEIASEVVEWIAEGKTLREYCRQPNKPSYGTIYNWINKDDAFAQRFACAREQGEDVIAQECLEIADDGTNDWETRTNKKGVEYEVPNVELVMRSRLRIETRLKLLAKWNPRKYGDSVKHVGADGESAIQFVVTRAGARPKEPDNG